jgi:PAS domain S-box-containing protein
VKQESQSIIVGSEYDQLVRGGDLAAQALIENSPIAAIVTNPHLKDNPIVAVNDSFCKLTGFAKGEILGRNCRFLSGKATQPWLTEKIREGVREKKAVLVEILNYKKDGTPFQNAVIVAPVFDDNGDIRYFLGSQIDIGKDNSTVSSARRIAASEKVQALSGRQREVLQLIAEGLLNKQIAGELGVTERTVKMHRALVMERLGVNSVAELIRVAVEAGL